MAPIVLKQPAENFKKIIRPSPIPTTSDGSTTCRNRPKMNWDFILQVLDKYELSIFMRFPFFADDSLHPDRRLGIVDGRLGLDWGLMRAS